MKFFRIILLFTLLTSTLFAQQKKFTTYKVKNGESIESISKTLGIDKAEILNLNPDVTGKLVTNQVLVVPNKAYNAQKDVRNFDTEVVTQKDIVVDGFVYHEVLPKETLYGISSQFKISTSSLKNNNPFLISEGLQIGQILKIPLAKVENPVAVESSKPYLVRPKDTKFSIAKQNNISIEELEKLNPNIVDGLKIDDIIYIPSSLQGDDIDGFAVHEVKKGETIFSISKLYGIPQATLLNENPELAEGLKEGILIKITPMTRVVNSNQFVEPDLNGKKKKIAFLFPFMHKKDSLSFETDRLMNATTDFYFGALLALDSLKSKGMNIEAFAFDTEKSVPVSKKIVERNNLKSFDLLIGPMYLNVMEAVANEMNGDSVWLASPLSEKSHAHIKNSHLIQATPQIEQFEKEMIDFIKQKYSGQKVVLIHDETNTEHLNYVVNQLRGKIPQDKIKIIQSQKGYITSQRLKEGIVPEEEVWFVLVTQNEVLTADVVQNIGVLPEEINLTFFAFDKGKVYEKIDNKKLARIKFHYPSYAYQNYDDGLFKIFSKKYLEKYKGLPTEFSIKGFDITYDLLVRLSEDFLEIKDQGYSERIWNKFNYANNPSGGIENHGIFILAYDGLSLKNVSN
ncbi:LysM peptidoglycan-binding domain-containing protein [Namhaeicola litoreus]|uniref:LysM peptidoglycan-binding domain-containing protein n=1 Tax=Namhaeicola litoreus TaxID=1052145 RepID=A0ABW3Y1K9_9FLAO